MGCQVNGWLTVLMLLVLLLGVTALDLAVRLLIDLWWRRGR